MAGLEACESLSTRPKARKMAAEKFLVRRFSGSKQALEEGDLDNAFWLPGAENPADGLTKVRSDLVPQ